MINYLCLTWLWKVEVWIYAPHICSSWSNTTSHLIWKVFIYNIALRWFLLRQSLKQLISCLDFSFVIKFFSGSMVHGKKLDWFREPKVYADSATNYVILGGSNLLGPHFSTWEMKNLKWITTKSPFGFKIPLFMSQYPLLSDMFHWPQLLNLVYMRAFKYIRTYGLLNCLFEAKQDQFL